MNIKSEQSEQPNKGVFSTDKLLDLFYVGFKPIIAILLSFVVSGIIIYLQGKNPIEAYVAIFNGAFGSLVAFANTCVRTTPLLIGALGMTLGVRGGIFNVGAEGQLYIGAAFATTVGLIPLPVPSWLHVILCMLAGVLGGSLFALLPAYLKAYRGISEIVVTIMMNFVAQYFNSYLVHDPRLLAQENASYAQSRTILDSATLPILVKGTSMHLGIVIAVILAIVLYFVIFHTRFGFRTRVVGANPVAANYAGINVKKSIITTFLIVGGFSGLMGAVEILGLKHILFDNFSGGMGFETVTVALLGGVHPFGVLAAAFFFGGLRSGGNLMQQTVGVSTFMVQVIQALSVLFIVGMGFAKPTRKRKNVEAKLKKAVG